LLATSVGWTHRRIKLYLVNIYKFSHAHHAYALYIAQCPVLEANAKVNGRNQISHPSPPKPINQSGWIFDYVTTSAQRVDMQNLIWIDSTVASVRPSVCLSQVGVVSKRLNRSSWFWTQATHDLSYIVLMEVGYLQNKGTSCWDFVSRSGLQKISQVHVYGRKCCQLRWTLSVINWRRSSVASLSH